MIGYAANGYRLWDKISRRIVVARDVKFDESCYPYNVDSEGPADAPLVILPPDEQEGECSHAMTNEDTDQPEVDDENPGGARFELTDDEEEVQDEDLDEHDSNGSTPGALPSQPEQHEPERDVVLRRSERERKLPGKFLNFFTGYRATSAGPLSTDPPECYSDIPSRDDREQWLRAVKDELKSMDVNGVWKIVRCPPGVRCLKSKWVFRIKEDENGHAPLGCLPTAPSTSPTARMLVYCRIQLSLLH
ncbi:hypothetical protein RP20_CCG001348 [Aedes albopictus]|nr:hypothetical protein RP20_CCG001348 [Aedes albopictus]